MYARRIRLTITGYDYERQLIIDPDTDEYVVFEGSYLREIEVYTYTDAGYINSDDWPVVAIDLTEQFAVTDHSLINKDVTDSTTDWDNDESFFKYSDNIFDDPKKVSFTKQGSYVTYYQKTDDSGDLTGTTEYIFGSDVYFDEGIYTLEWGAYAGIDLNNADYPEEEKISLVLEGPTTVEDFATVDAASTWLNQTSSITVPVAGYYTVKSLQYIAATYEWRVRNPYIYRSQGLIKWVAVTRDTAENYSYDDDSGKYGKDYLTTIKVYGDEKYNPAEYGWWWNSRVSTLSNDGFNVRVGKKSLKIEYPASSDADTITFIEGDDFGQDIYFDAKDLLHFWWRIDDVSKLDTEYGDITFGVVNSADNAYYKWDLDNLSLSSGWNNIKLKFEDADEFYPMASEFGGIFGFIHSKLDFRNNGKDFSSLRLRFRGMGQAFIMNLDGLKIQRNVFDDSVVFDKKGLCLTGYDHLEIPLSSITLEKGSIEFWTKFYTDSYSRNIFNDMNSRSLFSMVNNNNNLISLGIKSGWWLQPIAGHLRKDLNTFDISNDDLPSSAYIGLGDVVHMAMVWSNDGKYMSNGETMRLYINGELMVTSRETWDVGDTKSAIIKLGGASAQMSHNQDTYGSAVFSNVKLYNYCKTEFDVENEGITKDVTYTPNEFLQVSKNNIDFYGVGSANLPLIFEQVPASSDRTVYVRANKNENFEWSKNTATLIIDWLTTV